MTFKEAKAKHKIETCYICQKNLELKKKGRSMRLLAMDGIHGNSLVDEEKQ